MNISWQTCSILLQPAHTRHSGWYLLFLHSSLMNADTRLPCTNECHTQHFSTSMTLGSSELVYFQATRSAVSISIDILSTLLLDFSATIETFPEFKYELRKTDNLQQGSCQQGLLSFLFFQLLSSFFFLFSPSLFECQNLS